MIKLFGICSTKTFKIYLISLEFFSEIIFSYSCEMAIANYKDFLSFRVSSIIPFFICCVYFTLTGGYCMQLVASITLGRLNRSWFSGKLFTTKLGLLFCFGSFFLVEIASFINIFLPIKSIPSSFRRSWYTFSCVTKNALDYKRLGLHNASKVDYKVR